MAEQKYRTITVSLTGDNEGQSAVMRAEGISARIFVDLSSSAIDKQMAAIGKLVISHNLKDADGIAVDDVLDAPIDVLAALTAKWGEEVAALPPR